MKLAFNAMGEKKSTFTLSNLGVVTMPPELSEHITRMDVLLGVQSTAPYNSALVTYKGKMYLNIIIKEIENFKPTHIVLMGSAVFKTNLFTHRVGEKYNSSKHLFKKIQGTSGIVVAPILHIAYYGKILSNIMKKGNCSKKDCFKNFLKGLV